MENKIHISIVSPIYKAENIICELVQRLETVLFGMGLPFEIILIEDGSPDNSWQKISEICVQKPFVKGISLSRNFGQHYAITAGLDAAQGEWVVVMDCDLQDQPEEIPRLYEKARQGFDIVCARRTDRKDSFLKKFYSRAFWNTLGYLTGSKIDHTVANFGIYHKNVVAAICSLRESIRFFPSMVTWVGFRKTSIDVEHAERHSGSSSYNFSRMFTLALDIILAYSDKPMRLFIRLGFFISLLSIFVGGFYFFQHLTNRVIVPGYTSLIISIWFLSGLIIFILGIIGLYLGKTFEGVKKRPIYIIRKKEN